MSWLSYRVDDGYVSGIFENGKEVKFSNEDLPNISKYRWYIDTLGYATTTVKGKNVRMHRFLISEIPDKMVVDHINRNKLDNRRENLRVVTQQENTWNVGLRQNNTSGVTGVFLDNKTERWRAQIYHEGKVKHVGIFDDFADAVKAREEAELNYYRSKNNVPRMSTI